MNRPDRQYLIGKRQWTTELVIGLKTLRIDIAVHMQVAAELTIVS